MQKMSREDQLDWDRLGSADPDQSHHILAPKDDSIQGIELVPKNMI
jgi:hypothetical protein